MRKELKFVFTLTLSAVISLALTFVVKHRIGAGALEMKERCKASEDPRVRFQEGMTGKTSICESLSPQEASTAIPWRIR